MYEYKKIEIQARAVCKGYIHLSVAIPLKISISYFIGFNKVKAKSTMMLNDRPQICKVNKTKRFGHGNIDGGMTQKYIRGQAVT